MKYDEIQKITEGSTFYGKSYTVEVWLLDTGKAIVQGVRIEGFPTFKDPLDGDVFETSVLALNAGHRFACSQIGN